MSADAGELLEPRVPPERRERRVDTKPTRRQVVGSTEQLLEQVQRLLALADEQIDARQQVDLVRTIDRIALHRKQRHSPLPLGDRVRAVPGARERETMERGTLRRVGI